MSGSGPTLFASLRDPERGPAKLRRGDLRRRVGEPGRDSTRRIPISSRGPAGSADGSDPAHPGAARTHQGRLSVESPTRWHRGEPSAAACAGWGRRQIGKAAAFGAAICRFESCRPSHPRSGRAGPHGPVARLPKPDASSRCMQHIKLFTGNANTRELARGRWRELPRDGARQGRGGHLQRRRGQRRDRGERPGHATASCSSDHLHPPTPPDGAADHDRRAAALVGAAHHRRDALLRLRAAGPQGRAAAPDLGEARRRSDLHRRDRPACCASTCTRARSRASSTSRSTTSTPRPCCSDAIRPGTDEKLTIISPDAGGVERSRAYAKRLNASLAIIDKRREAAQRGRGDEHRGRRRGAQLHRSSTTSSTRRAPSPRRPSP